MTKYGICELTVVPVRKFPSDQSEMINQLIFGDLVSIIDSKKGWHLVLTVIDNYEGWIDIKQVSVIEKPVFEKLLSATTVFLSDTFASATSKTGKTINLFMGSRLPGFNNNTLTISDGDYVIDANTRKIQEIATGNEIAELAMKYLGSPYLWGGRSPVGIDCSGFTQVVFGMAGIKLPRDSNLQAEIGETINFIDETIPGDLAFFDNAEERIIHVGIILENKKIIHASGKVRIDSIDHQGIYNEQEKRYSHKLRIIKRII